jgi:hypothetical protein
MLETKPSPSAFNTPLSLAAFATFAGSICPIANAPADATPTFRKSRLEIVFVIVSPKPVISKQSSVISFAN